MKTIRLLCVVLFSLFLWSRATITKIESFDFIAVGGGSGGMASATKLAEAGYKTVILERGIRVEDSIDPDIVKNADKHKWVKFFPQLESYYFGVPNVVRLSDGTNYTITQQSSRGTMARGSGGHNGVLARWGVRQIYDQWPRGWRSRDLEPYLDETYRKMKTKVPTRDRSTQTKVMNQWRSRTGYPIVSDAQLFEDLINGIQRTTFTYEPKDNDNYFERVSSYDAFFLKCKKPKNIRLDTSIRADYLIREYEPGELPRIRAVLATNVTSGEQILYYGRLGVNLHGGPYENFALMARSGFGNCTELVAAGFVSAEECISVPGLGTEFYTHQVLAALVGVNATDAIVKNNTQFTTQVGLAFSTEGRNYPDALIDFHMQTDPVYLPPPFIPQPVGFAILYSLKDWPCSIKIDPLDKYKVKIDFQLFQHPWQLDHMVKVVKEYLRLLNATTVYTDELPSPISPGYQAALTDDAIKDLIVKNVANGEHPLAVLPLDDVVDKKLRLPQVQGLRIMDSSVLPKGNHANINMITIAVALKGTDILIDDARKGRLD